MFSNLIAQMKTRIVGAFIAEAPRDEAEVARIREYALAVQARRDRDAWWQRFGLANETDERGWM